MGYFLSSNIESSNDDQEILQMYHKEKDEIKHPARQV